MNNKSVFCFINIDLIHEMLLFLYPIDICKFLVISKSIAKNINMDLLLKKYFITNWDRHKKTNDFLSEIFIFMRRSLTQNKNINPLQKNKNTSCKISPNYINIEGIKCEKIKKYIGKYCYIQHLQIENYNGQVLDFPKNLICEKVTIYTCFNLTEIKNLRFIHEICIFNCLQLEKLKLDEYIKILKCYNLPRLKNISGTSKDILIYNWRTPNIII